MSSQYKSRHEGRVKSGSGFVSFAASMGSVPNPRRVRHWNLPQLGSIIFTQRF